jgi:two-component system response regulator DctR
MTTAGERQVMEQILAVKLNKIIADEIKVSMRTVEVHRANLFKKMGVKTAVELAQVMAGASGKPITGTA